MKEIWKPIKDYEGYYEISSYGNIKSLDRIIKSKGNSLRLYKGKDLLQETTKDNYKRIVLMKNGIKKRYMVHRLVALTFLKNPYNKTQINHIDGNKSNNNLSNLEWVTPSENSLHAYKIGLHKAYYTNKLAKPVKCLETNETFTSLKQAGIKFNVAGCNITRAIQQNRKCKGYTFVYI